MTHVHNAPHDFADEALEGFVAAYPDDVVAVPGGVVRAEPTPPGQVAVVLGGGAGHYPAFAGWVGAGFAHGAACGNTFASPSASQVHRIARAVEAGAGVLLGFGNYAGDVMQFGLAAQRLRAEGIDARTVAVTDDLASGPASDASLRRGVAGDLLVFKMACAAAARGMPLDAVEAVAQRANTATRSFGVAFSGCTLPGATTPLFGVRDGHMALGLGIHGEPGLGEHTRSGADDLADLLVDKVLADVEPAALVGARAAVLVNGLGATKYEELFVVYRRVAARLSDAGLTVVRPEVGEHVTSLDMAGLSLSLTLLDDELASLWTAPADAPAFRRGAPGQRTEPRVRPAITDETAISVVPGSPASQAAAATAADLFTRVSCTLAEHEQRLGDIDAVAGDGDHGMGMARGSAAAQLAAAAAVEEGAGARTTVLRAATAWADAAGGSSGALWGVALTAAAARLSDESAPSHDILVTATAEALDSIVALGGAQPGDKTMVDAAAPFTATLQAENAAGTPLHRAWASAAHEADRAALATADIPARLGRARAHGDASLGTPDAGAVSFALVVHAITPASTRTLEHS